MFKKVLISIMAVLTLGSAWHSVLLQYLLLVEQLKHNLKKWSTQEKPKLQKEL